MVIVAVAANDNIPVLDVVTITTAEAPTKVTLVGSQQSRIAKQHTIIDADIRHQVDVCNRFLSPDCASSHMATSERHSKAVGIGVDDFGGGPGWGSAKCKATVLRIGRL